MKLYYSAGSCSLSPHIVLREAELDFELVKVDNKTKKTKSGEDFLVINQKGYVPVLELDDGERLTEGPAILQYLADRAPQKTLAPQNGTFARYRLQEWLNFITSELHKSFAPLVNPATPEDYKPMAKAHGGGIYGGARLLVHRDELDGVCGGRHPTLGATRPVHGPRAQQGRPRRKPAPLPPQNLVTLVTSNGRPKRAPAP